MNEGPEDAGGRLVWGITLALAIAALLIDASAWLGPRYCPLCTGRRSLRQRIGGYHPCMREAAARASGTQADT